MVSNRHGDLQSNARLSIMVLFHRPDIICYYSSFLQAYCVMPNLTKMPIDHRKESRNSATQLNMSPIRIYKHINRSASRKSDSPSKLSFK